MAQRFKDQPSTPVTADQLTVIFPEDGPEITGGFSFDFTDPTILPRDFKHPPKTWRPRWVNPGNVEEAKRNGAQVYPDQESAHNKTGGQVLVYFHERTVAAMRASIAKRTAAQARQHEDKATAEFGDAFVPIQKGSDE